jgi:Carbohydrate-selective porin, OprB family
MSAALGPDDSGFGSDPDRCAFTGLESYTPGVQKTWLYLRNRYPRRKTSYRKSLAALIRFSDAIAAFEADPQKNATTCPGYNYGSDNASAPDLCWVRRPNARVGVALFGEQYIARDIGVFSRVMYSDGKTEVDGFTSTDRSASFGTLAKGSLWARPRDVAGIGVNLGWISKSHAEYPATRRYRRFYLG